MLDELRKWANKWNKTALKTAVIFDVAVVRTAEQPPGSCVGIFTSNAAVRLRLVLLQLLHIDGTSIPMAGFRDGTPLHAPKS